MKKVLETINGIVLFVMFLMVMVTVVFRNILRIPSSWSQELSQYIFVFIVFVGSAAIMQEEKHISIDTIVFQLPPIAQRVVRIIGRLCIAPFLYVLVSGSFHNISATWHTFLPTVPWFRIGVMYSIVMVCGLLMSFYLVVNLIQDLRGRYHSDIKIMGTDLNEIAEESEQ